MSDHDNTPHTNAVTESAGGAFGFVRNGYDRAQVYDLTTADVENATVYGRNEEIIGAINALKIGIDGKITGAVIDVGGFLGLGVHTVLLPFDQLTVLRETNGSDVRIHLDTTRDQLKAMPLHGG